MANENLVPIVRNAQIWADRNGGQDQVYGNDTKEIELFTQRLKEQYDKGELTDETFKLAMGYCVKPQAENWQASNNNNAKGVLKVFASDMDFDSKVTLFKQLLGEDKVESVVQNRDLARPIVIKMKDGTIITYNKFREELSYKNDNTAKYYYLLDTGEFIEEVKNK